jgi:hypothetical protein
VARLEINGVHPDDPVKEIYASGIQMCGFQCRLCLSKHILISLTGYKLKVGIQNHWDSEVCPLSGILNNYKTQCFGILVCFYVQVEGGTLLLFWVP